MHLMLALALAIQLGSSADDDLLLKVGDPAPPFSMRDLDRKMFSLRNYTGQGATEPKRAVVMAFFATWCKPCMKEIPIIKKLYRGWRRMGVEVVYLGLAQGKKELGPFAKKHKLPWPVVPDSFGLLARRYGASRLPHLLIVDADGRIAFQHRGITPELQQMLNAQLTRITGGAVPEGGEAETVVDKRRFESTYTLARAPSGAGSTERWRPLAAYLSEQISANLDLMSTGSYEEFKQSLREGKFDLANAGPMLCHEVRDQYEPIARIERQGAAHYFGILFALRDSGISKLTDLKGKTIGLVSERSTSGGLFPRLTLMEAGLDPSKDVTIQWLGTHPKVAEAVKAGTVAVGGCYEDCRDAVWHSQRAKARHTRVLAYTPQIPGEMIIVKRSLAPDLKAAMRKAVLAAGAQAGILSQISEGERAVTGFVASSEADLKAVDEVIKRVAGKSGGGH